MAYLGRKQGFYFSSFEVVEESPHTLPLLRPSEAAPEEKPFR